MTANPCEICEGACCESLVFPAPDFTPEGKFLSVRGTRTNSDQVEVETRCPKLTPCGSCGIHADRPEVCRTYQVGGPACVSTVMRRRHGQQRAQVLNAIAALGLSLDQ
jgi:Fe-S-cluster containining protein